MIDPDQSGHLELDECELERVHNWTTLAHTVPPSTKALDSLLRSGT